MIHVYIIQYSGKLSRERIFTFLAQETVIGIHGRLKHTVGGVLNAWFNDCVLDKSGQSTDPIIAMVDPVPYNLLIANVGKTHNSQLLIDTRN